MAALSSVALAGLSLAGAYQESVALSKQAASEKLAAEMDAEVLRVNADLKEQAGQEEYNAFKKRAKKMLGDQMVAQAASGVDIGYGTAKDVRAETELEMSLDADRIRNNATLEAFGLRSKASQVIMQGNMSAQAYKNKASATMLGGYLNAGAYLGQIKVPKAKGSGE